MKNNKRVIVIAVVGLLVAAISYLIISSLVANNSPSQTAPAISQSVAQPEASPAPATNSTEQLLLYLIEEEKLAHDVYSVMYQKYGANVFGNILKSEQTHQGRVLTLLQARNIADTRSSEVGVFQNQELQALYNQLIEQGNKSATEAYKVGVIIEEKDIADISAQLATATDEDVITTLESLRAGSESHLRAFNKQL